MGRAGEGAAARRSLLEHTLRSLLDHLTSEWHEQGEQWSGGRITRIDGGWSNLLYRVTGPAGDWAVKFTVRDKRDRAGREYQALLALRQAGLSVAPEPLFLARRRYPQPVVVQTWLEGEASRRLPQGDAEERNPHFCVGREPMPRVQAIVVRDGRVLMVKHHHRTEDDWCLDYWCLPGGALEPGETPEEGALRELREECNVDGVIVRETGYVLDVYAGETYSFLIDIGDQQPSLGHDPEFVERSQAQILVDLRWLHLSEIPERDRAFLWAAGLLGVGDFLDEVESWGSDVSYPGEERAGRPDEDNR